QPCDPLVGNVAAHLVEPVSQRTANRHPDRPTQLDGEEILPDRLAVRRRQVFQERAGRFVPAIRPKEDDADHSGFWSPPPVGAAPPPSHGVYYKKYITVNRRSFEQRGLEGQLGAGMM